MYHLHLSTGSRGGGQSAKAKSDYVTRQGKYENQQDKCIYTNYGNMPNFAEENPDEYWNAADEHERINGRLFTEIVVALPVELTDGQNCYLANRFAQKITEEKNLPYIVAVHEGKNGEEGKSDNPHAHIVISDRANDGIERSPQQWFKRANKENPEQGGAAKDRDIKGKEWLKGTREQWTKTANQTLGRAGHQKRIDHRSLKDQGIDREPQRHIGPRAYNMAKEGADLERTQVRHTPEKERAINQAIKSVEREIKQVQRAIEQPERKRERSRDRGLER